MSSFLNPVLEPWRERAFRYFVGKKLRAFKTTRKTVSYSAAKQIGVLFDASHPEEVILVDRFVEMLSADGKKVRALGFYPQKARAVRHFDWFDRQGINWWGQPTDKNAQQFLDSSFDILISAWRDKSRPLEFLATFSKAKWRVAPHHEQRPHVAEFTVRLHESKDDLGYYLSQVEHFLKTIKTQPTDSNDQPSQFRTVTA